MNAKDVIDKFFLEYAGRFNAALAGREPDVAGIAGSFSDCFIEASPMGVSCAKNDQKFREVIPEGYDFYKSIGTQSMKIIDKEITVLDTYHVMTKVRWSSAYIKKDNSKVEIDFDVFYFIQLGKDGPQIFAYITGDEQKVLRESGLLPAQKE